MQRIIVDVKSNSFVYAENGDSFFPYGVNYDHNGNYQLIEDFWNNTDEIEDAFSEIKKMGFNIVRIHLQQFVFQKSLDQFSEEALSKLDYIVKLSHSKGLYLDITGLGRYKGTIPEWYKKLNDEERINADTSFWRTLAIRYKGNMTIFCFDIQNEPIINSRDGQGYTGEAFDDGYHYINKHFQNVSLNWDSFLKRKYDTEFLFRKSYLFGNYKSYADFQKSDMALPGYLASQNENSDFNEFKDYLALKWLKPISDEIKINDETRLVTLGLSELNFPFNTYYSSFAPDLIKPYVDFIAIHIYPKEKSKTPYQDNAEEVLKMINAANVGKPLVVEEMFPLLPLDKLYKNFIKPSQVIVKGWISFYWGIPASKLKESDKIKDMITAEWLTYFSENRTKIIGLSAVKTDR